MSMDPGPTDIIASLTSTALEIIATATTAAANSSHEDWAGGEILNNGTVISPVDGELIDEGSYILNTVIGLIIVLIASVLNALGLNLTKLDHTRQQGIPKRERRKEYLRVLWLAGIGTYIASQVFGSPLALKYLRPDWVAPLGSSSLIFNFLFARWLVGTPVTSTDIQGTAVIVLGVILILVFSSINHGLSQSISISNLNSLWSRIAWLAYFALLIVFTGSTYFVSSLLRRLIASRASYSPLPSPTNELPTSRPKAPHPILAFFGKWKAVWNRMEGGVLSRMEKMFIRTDDARIIWLQGIGWAVGGGSLAGLCLVFTKVVVKIFWLPGHPLVHPSALITLLLVIFTAILQIVCLNRALECADTVVVVPLFYAGYTVFGFVNSLIFFDQTGQYARWVLVAVFLSISVLIAGVVLLSLKSSAKTATDPYTVTTQPSSSMRLRPTSRVPSFAKAGDPGTPDEERDVHGEGEGGAPREDVLWEVGSVSDDGSENAKEGRGVGGGIGGRGERRGLLGEDDDEEDEEGGGRSSKHGIIGGVEEDNPFADMETRKGEDDDGFGEYEGIGKDEAELSDADDEGKSRR